MENEIIQTIDNKCSICSCELTEENKKEHSKTIFCENCFSEKHFTCNECGDVYNNLEKRLWKENSYCDECINEISFICCSCDERTNNDESRCWNDDRYCQSCLDEDTFICNNCGDRYHNDDYGDNDMCQGCDRDNNDSFREIELNFEKIKSKTFKNNPYKQFAGCEIECMNHNLSDNCFNYDELNKFKFSQVEDGSLSSNGVEFVSQAFQGDELLNHVKQFTSVLKEREFFVNSECGFHIHIGLRNNLEMLKKIFTFYSKYEDYFFDMSPHSRRNNHYCQKINQKYFNINDLELDKINSIMMFKKILYQIKEDKYVRSVTKQKYNDKRYCWINFHSLFYRGTLEVRNHAGTINPTKINNWFLIHLRIINMLKNTTLQHIRVMPKEKDYFLSLFNNDIQTYIKDRWKKFENINVSEENSSGDYNL